MEGDVGVVMLVEDGEAVVPVLVFMSALTDGLHALCGPSSCVVKDIYVLCVAVGRIRHFRQ